MVFVRLLLFTLFFSSCQLGYLLHVSYNHLVMLNSKEPVDRVLQSGQLSSEQKKKVELSQEARNFAFEKLQLSRSDNYSQYIDLKRSYVTYSVSASKKWRFEPHLWSFPFIGKAPYKAFYSEKLALEEAEELEKKDLDVSVRGVAAFSTLGKLTDPLLSSMLKYSEHSLVNTIIHELVHTTLFIRDNIDFNERLAVFVANKGTEQFYLEKEGPQSPTLQKIKNENYDDELFSKFITSEINDLKKWYEMTDPSKLPPDDREKIRQERLQLISRHFDERLKSQLKTKSYDRLFSKSFNNADLSLYNTYMKNLDVFEAVYRKNGANIPEFLKKCQELRDADDPEKQLEIWAGL